MKIPKRTKKGEKVLSCKKNYHNNNKKNCFNARNIEISDPKNNCTCMECAASGREKSPAEVQHDGMYLDRGGWSDKTKLELFGHGDVFYFWRSVRKRHGSKRTLTTQQKTKVGV